MWNKIAAGIGTGIFLFWLGFVSGRSIHEELLVRTITVAEQCQQVSNELMQAMRQCSGELGATRKILDAMLSVPVDKLGKVGGKTVAKKVVAR
jgi:hypothetical protein